MALGPGISHLGLVSLTVHEVEDEAELVGCVEGVRHAHDERAVLPGEMRSRSAGGAPGTPSFTVPLPCHSL